MCSATAKTSIRGGGGIFYGSVSNWHHEWNTQSNYQPFAVRQQFATIQSLTNPYGSLPGGIDPFPIYYSPSNPQFIAPSTVYGFPLNFKWPYTYRQFNFTLEHQITKDFTLGAGYVGSLGRRLPFAYDLNYPYPAANATTGNVNARRPIDTNVLSNIYSLANRSETPRTTVCKSPGESA